MRSRGAEIAVESGVLLRAFAFKAYRVKLVPPTEEANDKKTATLIAAILAMSASPAFAGAYSMDAKGKCHDEHGKFAKTEMCAKHKVPNCKKGKLCGDTCIAIDKICHG